MSQDSNSWREEVSTRLSSYRARRRPRPPRYPSLMLKFERPEEPDAPQTCDPIVYETPPMVETPLVFPSPDPVITVAEPAETGKIIEFPRLWEPPVRPADELAEPVYDQVRILEVPDVVPPPPALGGMLIEPQQKEIEEKRPGFDIPLQSAPMSQRATAAMIDAILVGIAFVLFATVFFKMTGAVPALQPGLQSSALLLALFWAGYQFCMTVFAGKTPGLKLAHLRLSRFDGTPVPRNVRRWRAVASILSGVSLGLGYAWCFLDEDSLCWHDRITRTYLAPVPRERD